MFFVYIIQSEIDPKQFYTGFSENIFDRLNHHNKGQSTHTSKFKEKKTALDFEKYLKTASGIAFRNKRFI